MKTLNTYIEQTKDPIRQQMLNYLAIEIELDRNIFENFDLSNVTQIDFLYKIVYSVNKSIK